jgi:hypothetical protein
VAANTSCRRALVNKETAVANASAKASVTSAIIFVDMLRVRNMYIGMRRRVVEAKAIIILINAPNRSDE